MGQSQPQQHCHNPPPSRRNHSRKWRLLDLVTTAFFAIFLAFLVLVFTPLGNSLAGRSRHTLLSKSASKPRHRHLLVAAVEAGQAAMEACSAEDVDHMPCQDPRRSSQLSREMNSYREQHCPSPEEMPLCLIPTPKGYRIPVQWPESMLKVSLSCSLY